MLSSASGAHSWPRYGQFPLMRCPDCPRIKPLVRLTCKKRDTGNYGREFVKCESRPQPEKILKQCSHFMWMDAYIEKLQVDGTLDLMGGAVSKPNLQIFAPAPNGTVNGRGPNGGQWEAELKKLNGKICELVELKKQENLIAGAFYSSVIIIALIFMFFHFR